MEGRLRNYYVPDDGSMPGYFSREPQHLADKPMYSMIVLAALVAATRTYQVKVDLIPRVHSFYLISKRFSIC